MSVNQIITGKINYVHEGYTPLMLAVQTGDSTMVTIMLAYTLDLFLLSKTPERNSTLPNQTALQIAIQLHKQTPTKAVAFANIIRQLINAYREYGFAIPTEGIAWLAEFGHSAAEAKGITTSASLLSSTNSSSSTTISSSPLSPSSNSQAIRARHAVPLRTAAEESDSEDDELANDRFTAPAISSPPPEHTRPFSVVDSKALNQPATIQTTLSASSSSSSALFQPAPRSQPVETKETKQVVAEHKDMSENQQAQQQPATKPTSEGFNALKNGETILQMEQIESTNTLER